MCKKLIGRVKKDDIYIDYPTAWVENDRLKSCLKYS